MRGIGGLANRLNPATNTSGGFKVIRLLIVARHSLCQAVTAFSPRSVIPLKVGGEVIPESQISAITGLGGLLMLSLLGGASCS